MLIIQIIITAIALMVVCAWIRHMFDIQERAIEKRIKNTVDTALFGVNETMKRIEARREIRSSDTGVALSPMKESPFMKRVVIEAPKTIEGGEFYCPKGWKESEALYWKGEIILNACKDFLRVGPLELSLHDSESSFLQGHEGETCLVRLSVYGGEPETDFGFVVGGSYPEDRPDQDEYRVKND